MLNLLQTFVGSPSGPFQHLCLAHKTLLFYPSADAIVILDGRDLSLVRVLAFWEAFPGTQYTKGTVSCISVDPALKIIVASMGTNIAAWSLSGVQDGTWRIHSSLLLPEDRIVTTLDIRHGLLAVGTRSGLAVYTLILDNDLPTWSQKWLLNVATPSLARFSPSLMYIATMSPDDRAVRLYSTTLGRETQAIRHPRPVTNITWRQSQASSRNDFILYTITSDSTLRIYIPVIDSPKHLQLHASLDLFTFYPFSCSPKTSRSSTVFWLNRDMLVSVLSNILPNQAGQEDACTRRIQEIKDSSWDLFLRVLEDGSMVISSVTNIDSRPPTLLRQFMLQQFPPSTLLSSPSHLYILPNPDQKSLVLITSPPLATFDLDPLIFFDGQPKGLSLRAQYAQRVPEEESNIIKLVRTPGGRGVGVLRSDGGEAWRIVDKGSRLLRSGRWPAADLVVVLDGGTIFATYSIASSILTLHSTPSSTLSLPSVTSLFSLPSNGRHESILGITTELAVVHILISDQLTLILHSHIALPLPSSPKMIKPVDPMGWRGDDDWSEQAVLLSVSDQGELAFWATEFGTKPGWKCTGKVSTRRTGLRMAKCSSAKKSALVVPGSEGEELTIWDSKESEFSVGLEFRRVSSSSEPIHDLDWSSTPDSQSILAVGYSHRVELLCQQRVTYFDVGPGWAICWTIDIGNVMPYHISDSICLANGSLLIAAGHQMYLFGQDNANHDDEAASTSLFEYVAGQNGPLMDYHPQMLLQCLLWEKVELVKNIIVNLARDVESDQVGKSSHSVPLEDFLKKDQAVQPYNGRHNRHYTSLFNTQEQSEELNEGGFSRSLVLSLIDSLESRPLPRLSPNEQAHLLVLIQTTLEINEQRRSLDANGLRYLISMRSFYILNRRSSAPGSPSSNGVIPRQTGRRQRLRYRDIIWAFHSESQDLLLNASVTACNGKMCWSDARALGVALWLNSVETMKSHMEIIARNEFMTGENRDPVACSLYYFALGKVKLVHGLWRQAAWHKEQAITLKFLSNDFTDPRWRTAALKNAFALLSKQRFEYAAAFFLLGGSLKDAVNVCVRQLSDFQLAIALARVVEQSNDGPILCDILRNTVIPIAFRDGNRWLGSWAFWLLRRRDLAVRILITPLHDIARALDIQITEIGDSLYDDPSLALLFSQLKSKTLQTAQGTSEISGRAEFNFVLQIARAFCRMGCHVLALDLVRSWSFERPSTIDRPSLDAPPSPTIPRHSAFLRHRRSSMLIDIDIPSLPPTRRPSPVRKLQKIPEQETIQGEGDLFARKAGLGSLMKSAKLDITVPEFDMNAFF